MAAIPFELKACWSGSGAPDPDTNLNLGGVIGSVISDPIANGALSMSGVTSADARGLYALNHAAFPQELRWTPTTNVMQLKNGLSGDYGTPITILADGDYFIPDDGAPTSASEGRGVFVTIVYASLPVGLTTVGVAAVNGDFTTWLFPRVTTTMQADGFVGHRCYYFKNTNGADPINNLRLYVNEQPNDPNWIPNPPGDTLEVGLDPVGIGDGTATGVATTIVAETNVPTGVTFSTPSYGSPLVIGNLLAGETQAVWFRASVIANTFSNPSGFTYPSNPVYFIGFEMELP